MDIYEKYSWVDMSGEQFRRALKAALSDEKELVTVAGGGGSGKSVIYRMVYDSSPRDTLPLASTGISAFSLAEHGIPAVTIHSALKIPPYAWFEPEKWDRRIVNTLVHFSKILIDEVSMVSANLMDFLLANINEARKRRAERGETLTLVLFGDVMQLPPVVDRRDPLMKEKWKERYGRNIYFFNSPLWRKADRVTIDLYDVYRQKERSFKDILAKVRMGEVNDEMLAEINGRVMPWEDFRSRAGVKSFLTLASTNETVDSINRKNLMRFEESGEPHYSFRAWSEGRVSREDFPHVALKTDLWLGEQVMCTANDTSGEFLYQNGTIGVIVDFTGDGLPVVDAGGRIFTVGYMKAEKFRLEWNEKKKIHEMRSSGSLSQIACRGAYAVTYHKAQGLTLDAAYLFTDTKDQETGKFIPYAKHSYYLGLSRVRTLDGLGLSWNLTAGHINANVSKEALSFFRSDRDEIR